MTRTELTDKLAGIVSAYIANESALTDPQIRINPMTLDIGVVTAKEMFAEIEDYDEMLEESAAAEGAADEEESEFQVAQNPDFYSVKELVIKNTDGTQHPDITSIQDIAGKYLP